MTEMQISESESAKSNDVQQPQSERARQDGEEDDNTIGWDGENDVENPMNWPQSRKWTNIALMSLLTIISPLVREPATQGTSNMDQEKVLMKTFHSPLLATFVVSIYFLGYAFGPLLFAPMSEIYGRVYLYHCGNVAFTAACIGAALSSDLGGLLVFRFLMGAAGSAPTTVGVGSIIDIVPLSQRGRAVSLWAMGPLLGPSIGPIIGGYLVEHAGWRWVFRLLAIMGAALGALAAIVMRETYAPVLLQRKVNRLRKETGNTELRSSLGTRNKKVIKMAAIRPLKLLIGTPMVTFIALYIGIAFGILNLLIATFSFVYVENYGFSEGESGLSFLPAGLGMMVGVPEVKLVPWLAVPTGLMLSVGLFIYGWTVQYQVHWIVPMVGVAVLSTGMMGVTTCVQNYLIDSYPRYASSGSAAITLFRSLIGGLLPLSGLRLYDALDWGWGNSLLGFIALGLVPIPVLFYYFGEKIRKRFDPVL
ncbi:hypothetical protein NM208_g3146 [Fusarium decemcellulare]|uniref:Uncharacterized protein n=1 Tax=Fusarium decemcellulare TaxID=57161 RepID=A0ACC1SQ08_9HYPO|nr:hypothetical protein NM208_g3146 [Fusarium decemcellulare]